MQCLVGKKKKVETQRGRKIKGVQRLKGQEKLLLRAKGTKGCRRSLLGKNSDLLQRPRYVEARREKLSKKRTSIKKTQEATG